MNGPMTPKQKNQFDRFMSIRDSWPRGLDFCEKTGQFSWVHPYTQKSLALGPSHQIALSESIEANIAIEQKASNATGVLAVAKDDQCKAKIIAAASPVETVWCGVYFLIDGHEITYVGISSNVGGRLREHQRDKEKRFTKFSFMPCSMEEAVELEVFYIQKFRPIHNVKDNPSKEKKPKYQPTKRERHYRRK